MFVLFRSFITIFFISYASSAAAAHPNLVINTDDVDTMRQAVDSPSGRFTVAYNDLLTRLEPIIESGVDVPVPVDSGGGYTHEQHKLNYRLLYDAGIAFQVSGDERYSDFVRDTLLEYAELYPNLSLHPKHRPNATNPGRLFWQSLNEAVWLVYSIQAYDLVYNSLSSSERDRIEAGVLRPMALFLSEDSPTTFNKVHNHGTWVTAAVGMTGFVLDEPLWVDRALYDLELSGEGGFLKQIDELFSSDGYYSEGPYYQRYALMPFVTFAKAIENNRPNLRIFEYRDNLLLKAIDTTIQLSYDGLFFGINDAIKSKGIVTDELVLAVAIAYSQTGDRSLLSVADAQDQTILSGDGLLVAQALDDNLAEDYQMRSQAFLDGPNDDQGALVVLRSNDSVLVGSEGQALVFKATSQGLGHGHFDKLSIQWFDRGEEVYTDYGAARFLNIESKNGGRYLPENETYAKQTIAHNTLVVNETSHFDGDVKLGNLNAPTLNTFNVSEELVLTSATINTAYDGVLLGRTLVSFDLAGESVVLDIFDVEAETESTLDLPVHYNGQLINTSTDIHSEPSLQPLSDRNGYQHLWLRGTAQPGAGLTQHTVLGENNRFYTHSSILPDRAQVLYVETGANDPDFNLVHQQAFITRIQGAAQNRFVSLFEPHGEYNPAKEYTLEASSRVAAMDVIEDENGLTVYISLTDGSQCAVAIAQDAAGISESAELTCE
ncbi:heparinase II/III domain-containing protein [Umboniibacter marinipuniceus]|uniref:Alginate lyase n=1 Tax=Umboniibacter marinipuniceus TaxID=569599 RepID=A0A3M0AAW7_9GAMM|nr:heparinase II/III family protein [Umboniibacter marinipuniceus]RMA82291.1 alginate lyase [Umboniibacter marinipuniceus]